MRMPTIGRTRDRRVLAYQTCDQYSVGKYHGVPPYHETQAYVARVIHEFNRRVLAREAQAHVTAQSRPATVRN